MENFFYVNRDCDYKVYEIRKIGEDVYKAVKYINKLFIISDEDLKIYCFKSYHSAYICSIILIINSILTDKPENSDKTVKNLLNRLEGIKDDFMNIEINDYYLNNFEENENE